MLVKFGPNYYDEDDPMAMYQAAMLQRRSGGAVRRFDEYFRCYPVAMLPGPDRDNANHGGKVFLPPSALDKLTRLHITYPMLFELINGKEGKKTHAGVLEFIAEEGKIYLPYWLMQTLSVEPGDLLQIKSTDLPLGTFIKLQPQDPSFLEISDPKAVLENAFRNFSCLTTGDIFTFSYNDSVYHIAVLETKPQSDTRAICTLETDLSVDFAPPVGYKEPDSASASGTSTPRSGAAKGKGAGLSGSAAAAAALANKGGHLHPQGTMAQAINYASIAPSSDTLAAGAKAASSNFLSAGHRLASKKGGGSSSANSSKPGTPKPSTPAPGAVNVGRGATALRATNGPQPLRLPPGKLFFGYQIQPVKRKDGTAESEEDREGIHFKGQGQSLRQKKGGDK